MNDCYDVYRLDVAAMQRSATSVGDAIALLRRARALEEKNAATHRFLGVLLNRAGEVAEAKQELERATMLAPSDPANWLALLGLLGQKGDEEACARVLKDAFEKASESFKLLVLVAEWLTDQGHYDEATFSLRRAS